MSLRIKNVDYCILLNIKDGCRSLWGMLCADFVYASLWLGHK